MYGGKKSSHYLFSKPSTSIDEILMTPDCTLERVLDHEDLLDELYNQNPQVVNYFDEEKLLRTLDYALNEPASEEDEKLCFKFPFIAAEVLSSENPRIMELYFNKIPMSKGKEEIKITSPPAEIDMRHGSEEEIEKELQTGQAQEELIDSPETEKVEKEDSIEEGTSIVSSEVPLKELKGITNPFSERSFSEDEEEEETEYRFILLEKLFEFLGKETEVNPLLAGYFAKIFGAILNQKKKSLLNFLFRNQEHLFNMIKHIDNKSISDSFGKLLSNDDKYYSGVSGEEYPSEKKLLFSALVNKMCCSGKGEEIINIAILICNLIASKQHLDFFSSEPIIEKLFNAVFAKNPINLRAALTIFITLIQIKDLKFPKERFGIIKFELPAPEPYVEEEIDLKPILFQTIKALPFFLDYLKRRSETSQKSQFGGSIIPFGFDRLKIIEFFSVLIKLKDEEMCKALLSFHFPELLLDLLDTHELNSLLHVKIYEIFEEALNSEELLFPKVFSVDCRLGEKILELLYNKIL